MCLCYGTANVPLPSSLCVLISISLLCSSGPQRKKKGLRVVGTEKTKPSGPPQSVRPVVTPLAAPAVKNEEIEDIPEIETMSRTHQEPDESKATICSSAVQSCLAQLVSIARDSNDF